MCKIALFFLIAASPFVSRGQKADIIFLTDSMVYYGLDFSHARLIGDFGNGDGSDMKTKMFPQWNDVVVVESQKYNLRVAFRKNITYDLQPLISINEKIDETHLLTDKLTPDLDSAEIDRMVRHYPAGEINAGLGLALIVDKFDRVDRIATIHVALFDISSKKLLLTDKVLGGAGGAGLRNYWANAIADVIHKIEDDRYLKWLKRYKAGKKKAKK